MTYTGNINKMKTEMEETVKYYLPIGESIIDMNQLIGKEISIIYKNQINCIACNKKTKTSFFQGYCFNCYNTLPQADISIIQPEKDRSFLGESRDMQWSEQNTLIPHYVYMALSGGLKVGVTREKNIPYRWIDQGANKAILIAQTPNRHIAGIIEVLLKEKYSDKTNWRKMLTGNENGFDLVEEKENALNYLNNELKQYASSNNSIININYPIKNYPEKVKSIGLEKNNIVEGILKGIKGQYLIFEDNTVINIRKHSGYLVDLIVK